MFPAATAVIHAESSVFVKPGSTISLTCSIKLFSSPPTNIQWYKDTRALNLDSARGGVSLENEKTSIRTTLKIRYPISWLIGLNHYILKKIRVI